jgi:hypothetical protein
MYVDESGDTGLENSPTRYFALSGIVVHEQRWREFIDSLIDFRRTQRAIHGLPVRAEIHASEFINKRAYGLEKHIRLAILRNTLDELAKFPFISITNILVDKYGKTNDYDVFENAWQALFQRFENTLSYGNFPGKHQHDYGMVITDATAGKKLTRLVRRMAVHNFVPHGVNFGPGARNIPVKRIIEDPFGKDSKTTLPIQMADVCAYFLAQRISPPNSYIRRKRARNYFDRLRPVLNTHASSKNQYGVVRL